MEFWKGPDALTLQAIHDELKEDKERMSNNLALLKDWISYQKHLPQNYDGRMLPIYLRGCKHDLEKAKNKIELYFIAKYQIPELFGDHDLTSDSYKNAAKSLEVVVLPDLTPEGYRVIIYKIGKSTADIYDIQGVMKRITHLHEIQNVEETENAGFVVITDDAHYTAKHLSKMIHPLIKKSVHIAAEAMPFRVKQMHIVNANPFVVKSVTIVKSFLKEKIRNRFHVHKDVNQLHDYIPAKMLPSDYGGLAAPMSEQRNKLDLMFQAKLTYLKEQEQVKCLYIPDKFKDVFSEEVGHGVDGSFRKLNLD